MIIEVKYRDIPFSQARKCQRIRKGQVADSREHWNELRGTTVRVRIPATPNHSASVLCDGPFFFCEPINYDDPIIVCPHVAVIGD